MPVGWHRAPRVQGGHAKKVTIAEAEGIHSVAQKVSIPQAARAVSTSETQNISDYKLQEHGDLSIPIMLHLQFPEAQIAELYQSIRTSDAEAFRDLLSDKQNATYQTGPAMSNQNTQSYAYLSKSKSCH